MCLLWWWWVDAAGPSIGKSSLAHPPQQRAEVGLAHGVPGAEVADAERRFGAGRKSLAYTLTYREKTRTLTNDEITVVHAKIRERLQRELGVELRE